MTSDHSETAKPDGLRLRARLRYLYHGAQPAAVKFRLMVIIVDLIIIGFFALAATNALLVLNLFAGSPWLFALSVLSMSCGHALCNLSGMAVVNKVSKPANRTGLLSTYLVVGYVGTIVPILGMGWLSDHIGLTGALIGFCACLGLLSALLGVISARARVLPVPRQ